MKTTESTIVKQLRAGDIQAFNALFEEYSGRLYRFGIKYLKSEHDTEEMIQNIFYKIWKNRERLDESKSFKSYIFTIAFNEIRNYFQHKSIIVELGDEALPGLIGNVTEEDVAYNSALDHVKSLLADLPVRQRQIFELSRFGNLSAKEIAEKLGISPKTVDNNVSEVIRYLRKKMNNNLVCLLFFATFCSL